MLLTNPFLQKSFFKVKTFGSSMYPLLHDGDIVFIKKKSFSKIEVNDIICVKKNGKFFTHRAIYKTKKYLVTRGDNNSVSDGKIYPRNIIGVVSQVKRGKEIIDPENIYLLQSTLYFKEIVKVKRAIEKAKIDFVFLKGLPLHLYYEGTHPRRIYADCDVLIDKIQFEKTAQILVGLGYIRLDTSLSKTQKRLKDKEVEVTFRKLSNGLYIEFDLHLEAVFLMVQLGKIDQLYSQELINSFSSKLLKEKRYININNQRVPILSKENLFIYLLLHLYHHNFGGTYRFDLIRVLIRKEKLNYENIAETIREFSFDNFIYPCLILFKKYYNFAQLSILLKYVKPSRQAVKFTRKSLIFTDVFDDDDRINSGINRFKNIFILSPNSYFKKCLIFFNKRVLYSMYLVFSRRFFRVLKSLE